MSVTHMPKLWSKSEVAEYLGLNEETVARMCRRRRLGFVMIGNKTKFTDAHIEQFLATKDDPEPVKPAVPAFQAIEPMEIGFLRALPSAGSVDDSGVYFLWLATQLVYIGQSECVSRRIGQHRQAEYDVTRRYIKFDLATALEVPWPYHLAVEAVYLRTYETPENRRR